MDQSRSRKRNESKQALKNVQVAIRVRPMNLAERNLNGLNVVRSNEDTRTIEVKDKTGVRTFPPFDKVYGPAAKQVDVYKDIVANTLEQVLEGYNATIFAYGQTGTGKTYTMEGERTADTSLSWEDDPLSGIIPRALHHLFDKLDSLESEFSVRVSFVEMYNEELYDLLGPNDADADRIRLYEDPTRKGSVIVQGCEDRLVRSKDEVYGILERGAQKRQTAATLLNLHSSRSHAVFTITVHLRENTLDGQELLKTGKLNLVDLAGSECIGRSGAVEKRAREAGNINQSLLTLGRVIMALVEKSQHVPYRESKLTRLLQDSLGGRTITTIIATLSPSSTNFEETISTLEYATRAKNIKNHPEINQKLTRKALIKEYSVEIERLRRDLQATREKNGLYIAQENYDEMQARILRQESELEEFGQQMQGIQEELSKRLEELAEMEASQQRVRRRLERTRLQLDQKSSRLRDTKLNLVMSQRECDFLLLNLEERRRTETELYSQALQLLEVYQSATSDVAKLHSKLDRKDQAEAGNRGALEKFRALTLERVKEGVGELETNLRERTEDLDQLNEGLDELCGENERQLVEMGRRLGGLVAELRGNLERLLEAAAGNQTANSACVQSVAVDTLALKESLDAVVKDWETEAKRGLETATETVKKSNSILKGFSERLHSQSMGRYKAINDHFENQLRAMALWKQQWEQHAVAQKLDVVLVSDKLDKLIVEQNEAAEQVAQVAERQRRIAESILEAKEALAPMAESEDWNCKEMKKHAETVEGECERVTEEESEKELQTAKDTKRLLDDVLRIHQDTLTGLAATQLISAQKSTDCAQIIDKSVGSICDKCEGQKAEMQTQMRQQTGAVKQSQVLMEERKTGMDEAVGVWSEGARSRFHQLHRDATGEADWTRTMKGNLEGFGSAVNRLLDTELQSAAATGETPSRRTWKFPEELRKTREIPKEEFDQFQSPVFLDKTNTTLDDFTDLDSPIKAMERIPDTGDKEN